MKKTRTNRKNRNRNNNTKKTKWIPSKTPSKIRKISQDIAENLDINIKKSSYSPTINQELVSLQSIARNELSDCNIKKAFQLKEPLKIGIPGSKTCIPYYTTEAKHFLLSNLAANKHVNPKTIVPPIQSQSNCWFNAMFVTFFVSDKGRKFFHFLRQLMIEGKQLNGKKIPTKIQNAFALLNFGIDACLTGNRFAYTMDTNSIIHQLYTSIPSNKDLPYIVDVDQAGNPLLYYISIINYLQNNSITLLFIRDANHNWREQIEDTGNLPHIIVLEIFDETKFNTKPTHFKIKDAEYQIDSAVVRDISQQHFCAVVTCEGQQMGYDGYSYHRIVPLDWKSKLNTNFNWEFEGTKDFDGTPLKWNFTKSYQMLMYYRVH
jgi:hypothetical protein